MQILRERRDTPCEAEAEAGTGGPNAVSVEHDECGDACVWRAPDAELGAPAAAPATAAEPARNRRAAERSEQASERNATHSKACALLEVKVRE